MAKLVFSSQEEKAVFGRSLTIELFAVRCSLLAGIFLGSEAGIKWDALR
jgi:hypothetical protein